MHDSRHGYPSRFAVWLHVRYYVQSDKRAPVAGVVWALHAAQRSKQAHVCSFDRDSTSAGRRGASPLSAEESGRDGWKRSADPPHVCTSRDSKQCHTSTRYHKFPKIEVHHSRGLRPVCAPVVPPSGKALPYTTTYPRTLGEPWLAPRCTGGRNGWPGCRSCTPHPSRLLLPPLSPRLPASGEVTGNCHRSLPASKFGLVLPSLQSFWGLQRELKGVPKCRPSLQARCRGAHPTTTRHPLEGS